MYLNLSITISGQNNERSRLIFESANENIEKWTNFLSDSYSYGIVLGGVIPSFITSFYRYFTSDDGNDAFRLPFFTW